MADELHAESIALARIWTIKRCLIHPSKLMIHKMCLCNACTQLHGKSDFLLDAVMFSSQDLHIYIFFHITRFTAVSGYFSFPLLSETSLFWKIVKHIFTFIEFCAAWCGVAAKLCKKKKQSLGIVGMLYSTTIVETYLDSCVKFKIDEVFVTTSDH